MATRVKPKVGDVFEVTLRDRRLAYLQMVSESETAEVVRVLAGRFDVPHPDIAALVEAPHEYMMFAELRFLVRDGYARRIGTWPVPSHGVWSGLRYVLLLDASGAIRQRSLGDGRTAAVRLDALPAPSERKSIPIWEIGDSLFVVDMLAASSEGALEDDQLAEWRRVNVPEEPADADQDHDIEETPGVQHFAVFAEDAELRGVIADLEKRGFACSVFTDPDAFDGQMLVIDAGSATPGFVDDQWDQVEEAVAAAGGQYDGWEART